MAVNQIVYNTVMPHIKVRRSITHEELKRLVRYSPTTGIFRRRTASYQNIHPIGEVMGGVNPHGYLMIQIYNIQYRAHRLAWFYMKGEWPPITVDHKDLNKLNNRWLNLRLATFSQQQANTAAQKDNKLKGVHFNKNRGNWYAMIFFNGEHIYLGTHKTELEAHEAYKKAAINLFGEFARFA